MATYNRNWVKGGTYFFTVNLMNRKATYLTDNIKELRIAIKKVKSKHPFIIHAWVLLPDHMHCIWQLPESDSDYATRWRLIKTHFTKQISVTGNISNSRQSKKEGNVWQRRYWEHTIKDQQDYQRHMDYVHINPLKHGYVRRVQDWPFSSFHVCVKKDIYPIDWAGDLKEFYGLSFGE